MKRIRTIFLVLSAGLILISGIQAQDQTVTLEAGRLKEAREPRVFGDVVLFTYEFPSPAESGQIHTVQAVFEHETYGLLHPYQLNEHGVYVLIVSRTPEVSTLRYRLVVDGVWTIDPLAPAYAEDRWGVRVSEFPIPASLGGTVRYPDVSIRETVSRSDSLRSSSARAHVEFRLRAESGISVALVGSFNGWDPFMTPMIEIQPGLYSRSIRLPDGEHLYYFLVNGVRVPDPNNGSRRWATNGAVLSVVQLP